MVGIINTGHSIHRIFNYNENKVKEGSAKCIGAENYPIDVADLSGNAKLNRLLNQAALHKGIMRNSVHISINFDPSEKLSEDRLNEITRDYMDRIGFGGQPYLVYQHFDSGHPHVHVVTLKVDENGNGLDTRYIAKRKGIPASRELEEKYGLVKATKKDQEQSFDLKPINAEKVHARKVETRRAIGNVLEHVLTKYKYTSLPELNAILGQYNVMADRCAEDSRTFRHGGLYYRVLDPNGKVDCKPVKASSFHNSPTLKFLQAKFSRNEAARMPDKVRLKTAIDQVLRDRKISTLEDFKKALLKAGIHAVLRQNTQGLVYGITYVDHRSKSVFNGSALGKTYSASGVQQQLGHQGVIPPKNIPAVTPLAPSVIPPQLPSADKETAAPVSFNTAEQHDTGSGGGGILENLMQSEAPTAQLPWHLRKNKKKKRKGIQR